MQQQSRMEDKDLQRQDSRPTFKKTQYAVSEKGGPEDSEVESLSTRGAGSLFLHGPLIDNGEWLHRLSNYFPETHYVCLVHFVFLILNGSFSVTDFW